MAIKQIATHRTCICNPPWPARFRKLCLAVTIEQTPTKNHKPASVDLFVWPNIKT
jgi:hypothetical protein